MGSNLRPHILYIMSDDHAANAISAYGSRLAEVFRTPNMDRLAREGIRLTNFFSTNSICTPARATILTGQYGHVNGVRTLSDALAPGYSPNLAVLLRGAGYQTGLFGKWHLHVEPEGFDEYRYLCGAHEQGTYRDPEFAEKGRGTTVHKGYVTDIITKMALEWLRGRDPDRPFFLMCHHKAPHDFWDYPERHEHLFDGIEIPVPDSLFEDKSHRSVATREYGSSVTPRSKIRSLYADFCQPDYVTGPLEGTEDMSFEQKGLAAYQKYLKDYLRTVAGIDDSVASLLDELEKQGILDDTIVIYTSDQGMFLGEHDYQDKRWSFEESLQAPFLIRYPEEITAGTVQDDLMANIDVAPTLLDFAGVPVSEQMQGFSCRGMLTGHRNARQRQSIYFRYWMHLGHRHNNPAHYGVRTDRWKLVFYYGLALDAAGALPKSTPAGWELYDMLNDPLELRNLYRDPAMENVIKELKRCLTAMKEELGDRDSDPELERRFKETGSE